MKFLSVPSFLSFLFVALLATTPGNAQVKTPYQVKFLGAKAIEAINEHEVLALFEVTADNVKNLPSAKKMSLKYSPGEGRPDQVVRIGSGARLMVFGKNVEQKSPLIYNYVKGKVDLKTQKNLQILAFYVKVPEEHDVDHMTFSYAPQGKAKSKSAAGHTQHFAIAR